MHLNLAAFSQEACALFESCDNHHPGNWLMVEESFLKMPQERNAELVQVSIEFSLFSAESCLQQCLSVGSTKQLQILVVYKMFTGMHQPTPHHLNSYKILVFFPIISSQNS